eukprot:TRINITY_DN18707_c0_g1_i1.p1 TRINITY_DN18707_c0_g1~~TRINITY_DN18707_c0_g1_i1.p1  ORF type:complete len:776 (+),score=151.82 TRINITY_DN18707_c0_g1_i1:268-2328(+)
MIEALKKPLPTTLWITPTHGESEQVKQKLREYCLKAQANPTAENGEPVQISPIPWVDNEMAWFIDIPRATLRKDPVFSPLHKDLIYYTNKGVINRQEECSMIPAHALQVSSGNRCLDMCAAPGSKTAQLLSMLSVENLTHFNRVGKSSGFDEAEPGRMKIFRGRTDYSNDEGVVVANDLSTERINILVSQIKRLEPLYPLAVFCSHDARYFPSLPPDAEGVKKRFDRILCDVMCGGDGTLRKAPHQWKTWCPKHSIQLHDMQVQIALRAAKLLEVGGRFVYSTCSMSPIENEAVVQHILSLAEGSLHLLDLHKILPKTPSFKGLTTWSVMDPQTKKMHTKYNKDLHPSVKEYFFPSDNVKELGLEKTMRVLPHRGNVGGFFVATFEKVKEMPKLTGDDKRMMYDSDEDEDHEQVAREKKLKSLKQAIAEAKNTIETEKAKAKLSRIASTGDLTHEIARYVPLPIASPPTHQQILEFYGFRHQFPMEHVLCRFHVQIQKDGSISQPHEGLPNQLLYCSKGAADIIVNASTEGLKRKWKIVSGGLRLFVKDRMQDKAKAEDARVASAFRIAHEAVDLVLPYMTERIVKIQDYSDTKKLLGKTKSVPVNNLTEPKAKEVAQKLSVGGCILLLKTSSDSYFAVSALKTRHALNVYADENEMQDIRLACGYQLLVTDESSPDVQMKENTAS